jgi:predicted Zn-dependent peptidase
MTYKKKVLKNGLRIIAVPMPGSPSVTVMSLVEAGSEYETKDKNGISHFLEHMFFKGTKNRPTSMDIAKEFDSIGAQNNAFTSQEITGYWAKAHSKHADKILDIIADMYLNPSFPETEMEKEKGVIIEEINMYEDLPNRKVHEVYAELLYGDQPAGWGIAGPIENIRQMKIEDFYNYRQKHYVAPKTTVVVAGNIEARDVFKKVEKAFKEINPGKVSKKTKVSEKQSEPQIKLKHKDTDQTHLVIGVRTFNIYDKRAPALRLLSTILGNGMSSRLFQKMREELGICYYVRSSPDYFTDHGNLSISAGVDKSRIDVAIKGILEEMKRIRDEKVSPEELQKAKDYVLGNLYLGLESSDAWADFYGFQEIMREEIESPKEVEKKIRAITAADIQKLAKTIMQDSKLNLAIVGNVQDQNALKKILKL